MNPALDLTGSGKRPLRMLSERRTKLGLPQGAAPTLFYAVGLRGLQMARNEEEKIIALEKEASQLGYGVVACGQISR
jgi:hypothetical protein